MSHLFKFIIIIGTAIVLVGLMIYLFGDKMEWIGNLPGDIRVDNDRFKFYFPVTTLILFSALLNVIIYIVRQLF